MTREEVFEKLNEVFREVFEDDDITVNDVCQAFRTIMVGMTFTDEAAGDMIASYLEEYYGDKYNVVNING